MILWLVVPEMRVCVPDPGTVPDTDRDSMGLGFFVVASSSEGGSRPFPRVGSSCIIWPWRMMPHLKLSAASPASSPNLPHLCRNKTPSIAL